MQYLKRIFFLVVLIGLSVLATRIQPIENTHFTIEAILFCIINIIIVIAFIGVYTVSKVIVRNIRIIIGEIIIIILLILLSYYEQFNSIFDLFITDKFDIYFNDTNIVLYIQFILGIWVISFVRIVSNKKIRRNNQYKSRRYIR